jgi:Flp pilus assembly protein TadD
MPLFILESKVERSENSTLLIPISIFLMEKPDMPKNMYFSRKLQLVDMKKVLVIVFAFSLFACMVSAQTTPLEKYVEAGTTLHDNGDYKGAIEQFKKALEIDSNSSLANYEISNTYFTSEDYDHAIEHSKKVIEANTVAVDRAYIIYGSALDMKGDSKEAIKVYKDAIKEFPNVHLLHYNLALTEYNMKEYKEAGEAAIEALKIKPTHASSHLLLAYVMDAEGSKAKALLALYYFLMLEPDGKRSKTAYDMMLGLLGQGVSRPDEHTINISLSDKKEDDEFRSAELMLAMLEASKNLDENKNKSGPELFYSNTKSFFSFMGEVKKESTGFWWDFYVDFFYSMTKNPDNVEAFCYYISQSKEDKAINEWLANNKKKIDKFSKWYAESGRDK